MKLSNLVFFLHALLPTRGVIAFLSHPKLQAPSSPSKLDATKECDVAIFGGGFGGLYTALAISRESRLRGKNLDIRLVDNTDEFVFLPLLYDLTAGTATEAEVCPRYKDLLQGTGVEHVKASLESLGPTLANLKSEDGEEEPLQFRSAVLSVGASPEAILRSVPGATEYAQPFYTREDAKATKRLLNMLEKEKPDARIAVVGGGYGGVELAACVQRRLMQAQVTLISRGPPMAGTRAEPLVDQALKKLGVQVEDGSVDEIKESDTEGLLSCIMKKGDKIIDAESSWDAILWTAGSQAADPVPNSIRELEISDSGRVAIDQTLRCNWGPGEANRGRPMVWALGDCAEITASSDQPAVPRTAQAAMQQAEIVAGNLLSQLEGSRSAEKAFVFQDLGSMLMLGGPNAALLAPKEDSMLAPIFGPVLDTMERTLGVADDLLAELPLTKDLSGVAGLSLGSHGLGIDSGVAPGSLAGSITGAARRAIYAIRMPTNQQRAVSAVSAALSTALSLAKEASDRRNVK